MAAPEQTDFSKQPPPHGMEPYDVASPGDLGALSDEQQEKMNNFKIETRLENEKYLRDHPEVECMLSSFLGDVLKKRPDDVRNFAAEHFTNPQLPEDIKKQLEEKNTKMRQNRVLQKF
ncbi:RIIa domain-containing protein 1 [Lamellibrachia satsuma]|nr:RIIa domain-containing protein 1 [Lamellibrachia satsuma]